MNTNTELVDMPWIETDSSTFICWAHQPIWNQFLKRESDDRLWGSRIYGRGWADKYKCTWCDYYFHVMILYSSLTTFDIALPLVSRLHNSRRASWTNCNTVQIPFQRLSFLHTTSWRVSSILQQPSHSHTSSPPSNPKPPIPPNAPTGSSLPNPPISIPPGLSLKTNTSRS